MVRRAVAKDVKSGPSIEAEVSPVAREAPWVYAIEMSVDQVLTYMKPDLDFADCYDGKIVRRQIGREPAAAGRFLAMRMRLEDARKVGVSPRQIFYAFGERLTHFHRALFDRKTDEIKPPIRDRFEMLGSDFLLLFSICLLPEHRGRDVGLATATRLIDILGGGCSLVVCQPIAAQFCDPIPDTEFHEAMRLGDFSQDYDVATRSVRRYWARLGFKPIGRTGIYALSPELARPDLDDFCDYTHGMGSL